MNTSNVLAPPTPLSLQEEDVDSCNELPLRAMYNTTPHAHIVPSSYLLIVNDMQVLLLFSLLPGRARRQVVVAAAPVILEVMESKVCQICRLHIQILESFRSLVNDLVQRLLLQLIP
jgi:hypothetical protein